MVIKPTTVMLLGFGGIVVWLLYNSAKNGPTVSAGTGPIQSYGGGTSTNNTTNANYAGTGAQAGGGSGAGAASTNPTQAGVDNGGGANDFFNATGNAGTLPSGGN